MAEYSIGHKERAYVGVESAHGAGDNINSGTYVRLHGSLSAGRRRNRLVEDDKRDNAAPVDSFDAEAWVEWAYPEGKFRPSGTLGAEPEFSAFLEGLLGRKNVVAVDTTVSSATVNGGTLAAPPTGLEVGDICRIGTHIRQVASVDGSDVTWEPPLKEAPAGGTVFQAGVTYKPDPDPTITLNIYRHLVHTAELFPGCWVNDGSIRWTRDGFIVAEFSGQGMGKRGRIGESTLGAAIASAAATTITLAEGEGVLFDVEDTPGYIQVGTEVMRVTGRNGDQLTVVRGQQGTTAIAAAPIGTPVTPWLPTPTLIGRAVTGIKGYFYVVDGSTVYTVPFENLEVTIQNSFEPRREAGHESGRSEFAHGYFRADPVRTVTFNAAFKFKRLANAIRDAADKNRPMGIVLMGGDTQGNIVAVTMPRVHIDPDPTPDSPNNGDTMLTITGTAYASSNEMDDQISIGVL